MLACYIPEPAPERADNRDYCETHTLLYRRYWLVIHWSGLLSTTPRADRAYVRDTAGRYYVRVAPERLTVLDEAAFRAWHKQHWLSLMRSHDGRS